MAHADAEIWVPGVILRQTAFLQGNRRETAFQDARRRVFFGGAYLGTLLFDAITAVFLGTCGLARRHVCSAISRNTFQTSNVFVLKGGVYAFPAWLVRFYTQHGALKHCWLVVG
jgi:hypothetical protein